MNSVTPSLDSERSHTDQCAAGLFEDGSILLEDQLRTSDTESFEYQVGERACRAWLVDPTVGLHRGKDSRELAVAAENPDSPPVHYLYFTDTASPYWLAREEKAADVSSGGIPLTGPLFMQRVAANNSGSLYRMPREAVSLHEVVMDALPGHGEIIKRVYTETLRGLQELAAELGCLPAHLTLNDICVTRESGTSTLIPPLELRTYAQQGIRSQLRALAFELASDIQKRAAIIGKDIDLSQELVEFRDQIDQINQG